MAPGIKLSRGLAIAFGVALPILETVRRWNNVEYWPALLDDWLIGALLLWGAWATRGAVQDGALRARGRRILCGAWGFTCGMGYASFFGHLRTIDQPDVGPFPHVCVTGVIGVGWVLAIVALLVTMVARDE